MKTQILAAIGEQQQPMTGLNAALAANDRLKFHFSLLQMALSHAEHLDQPAATLREERMACGIDDPQLDSLVAGARMIGKECHVTGAALIVRKIADDMRIMAAPVLASKPRGLPARLDGLLHAMPAAVDDLLGPSAISAITQISGSRTDSLHLLVMDLHKQLNALQADLAEEISPPSLTNLLARRDLPCAYPRLRSPSTTRWSRSASCLALILCIWPVKAASSPLSRRRQPTPP